MKYLFVLFFTIGLEASAQTFSIEPYFNVQRTGLEGNNWWELDLDYFYENQENPDQGSLNPEDTYAKGEANTIAYGLNFNYDFRIGLKVGMGVRYSTQTAVLDNLFTKDMIERKTLNYVQIPVVLGYNINLGKNYMLTPSASFIQSFLSSGYANYGDYGKAITGFDVYSRHTKYLLGAGINLDVLRHITERLSISAGLYGNRDFTDAEDKKATYTVNWHPSYEAQNFRVYETGRSAQYNYAYGAKLGIKYVLQSSKK